MSTKSLDQALEQLDKYSKAIQEGTNSGLIKATTQLRDDIIYNCGMVNSGNYTSEINSDYNLEENIGRVYTNSDVLVFNEIGTGVVGASNPHPDVNSVFKGWQYDHNNHGETGWRYPKKDGSWGRTSGIRSKHMFYDGLEKLKREYKDIVSTEINAKINSRG